MKATILVLLLLISNIANATSWEVYNWFTSSLNQSGFHFAQRYNGQSQESKNYLRNVCGVMNLLAVHNYYTHRNSNGVYVDDFSTSYDNVLNAVWRMYENGPTSLQKSPLWYYQKAEDLKNLALYRWNWHTALIRSSYNYSPVDQAYAQLQVDINMGRPVIALMKGHTPFEPVNPNTNTTAGIEHFITVLYANSNVVWYFDPWYGTIRYAGADTFKNSWVATFITFVSQP